MALISQGDLEARIGRSLTTEEENAFTSINNANQAYIEKIIGSSVEDQSVSSRYFDGGLQHLPIDPCTDISGIYMVDDDQVATYTYDTSDYTTEPINRTLKTMLRHRSGPFFTGINNIKVSAKFSIYGDADILAIVKDAMLEALEAELSDNDNIKRESLEGYSVEYATTQTKEALSRIKGLFPSLL